MRTLLAFLLFLTCMVPALSAGQKSGSDDRIFDQVRMRLATDADVKGGNFDVNVKDGVVTLKGRVDTEKGKSRASKLAKKVKGVKQVDNELVVGPPTGA
jgi:osmotically-inducible protein OsmY